MSSLTPPFGAASSTPPAEPGAPSRRQFLGYALAGSTLAVAAQVGVLGATAGPAEAVTPVPSNPLPYDVYVRSKVVPRSRL